MVAGGLAGARTNAAAGAVSQNELGIGAHICDAVDEGRNGLAADAHARAVLASGEGVEGCALEQ